MNIDLISYLMFSLKEKDLCKQEIVYECEK